MSVVAVIPVKKHSTRLYEKNSLQINKQTLYEHSILYAKKSKLIDRVIVSTDCREIEGHIKSLGIECIFRGSSLSGEVPLFDVYKHVYDAVVENGTCTYIVGLQPDNPDRSIDLDDALRYVYEKHIDDLFSVGNDGKKNGSLRILSAKALSSTAITTSSIYDECTNIHTMRDYTYAKYRMLKKDFIEVSGKRIGNNEDVFVVVEAACNHMCDMDIAKQLIDEAAAAGADAIKFQTYKAERLVTAESVAYWGTEKSTQLKYYKNLDKFEKKEYRELFDYAKERGIIGFSSPFDIESASMLNDLGMSLFKVASCEINNLDFLAHIARFNKPIILSTGASTAEEIDTAIDVIFGQGNFDLVLLACTLSYPTENNNANLNRIRTLRERYPNITIGLSDHTKPDENMIIPAIAVAMGAQVIEKHYTLDRKWTGSGHFFSIQPEDLKKMISNIDLALIVRGTEKLEVMPEEEKALIGARKSIVAVHDIKSGTMLTKDMLTLKRPGIGISSEKIDSIVGRVTKFEIASDSIIYDHMLCEESKDENTAYSCS